MKMTRKKIRVCQFAEKRTVVGASIHCYILKHGSIPLCCQCFREPKSIDNWVSMYRSIETWRCESAALCSNIIYIAEEQWEKLEKTCRKSALRIYLTNSSIPHCKPQQGLQKPVTSTGTYNKKNFTGAIYNRGWKFVCSQIPAFLLCNGSLPYSFFNPNPLPPLYLTLPLNNTNYFTAMRQNFKQPFNGKLNEI